MVKILTGDLRIGLREGLVEEAIAVAFDAPLDDVKEANMLLGDIGETALLALKGELQRAELSLFRPIKCMLASPEPTAEAIWARFATEVCGDATTATTTVYVEDKFDGIRAQLHRGAERVEIFSRDSAPHDGSIPELAEQARKFEDELILDGEIMAFEHGRKLTFFDLQKRLGRKSEGADLFAAASADVPVAFVAFDLLWMNGRSFLRRPLRERRELLRGLKLPPQFQIAEIYPAHSADEIEEAFQLSRRRLNEGLMVKDPESFYSPGRRGMFWFKLKKELATLDVVVVAAELGHGKRNHVLSDYTFAVRDETTGQLSTIGKAYSGLTDVEIAELTEHFKKQTIANRGRYREVKPDIVLEIAFDSIQPSTRHASGLALRFPRIKAIRRDKNVDAIDTLAYARSLARATRFDPATDLRADAVYLGGGEGVRRRRGLLALDLSGTFGSQRLLVFDPPEQARAMVRSTECPLEFAARPVWFRQAAVTRSRPAPRARVEPRPALAERREEERPVSARDCIAAQASRRFPSVESNWAGMAAYSAESAECGAALSAARDPALKKRLGPPGPFEVE